MKSKAQRDTKMSHRTDRRHRKKIRERQETPTPQSPPLAHRNGRHGDSALLQNPVAIPRDLNLIYRAIKEDWDIQPEMDVWLYREIFKVIRGPDGISDGVADRNSVDACGFMVKVIGANLR